MAPLGTFHLGVCRDGLLMPEIPRNNARRHALVIRQKAFAKFNFTPADSYAASEYYKTYNPPLLRAMQK